MLNPESLALTLDAVNEALFFDKKIPQRDRAAVARWLAERCAQPGSYESPAPTAWDLATPGKLFTGEPLTTRAGAACKLGNEASRALILLNPSARSVQTALQHAEERMTQRRATRQ